MFFLFTKYCHRVFDTLQILGAAALEMDFSSTNAAIRSLKRRTTTSAMLRRIADKLEGPFAGECSVAQVFASKPYNRIILYYRALLIVVI